MRKVLIVSLFALGACKAEDASGMWEGTAVTSVLGLETTYEVLIDVEVDGKELFGDGLLGVGDLGDLVIEVEGTQKRKKVEMKLDYVEGISLGPAVKVKGKIKDGEIDSKLSVGVSVVKTKADLLLTRVSKR